MSDKIIIRSNGEDKEISIPPFGSINFIIQNGKVYKIDKSETIIIKK
ncbi:DUF2292 domain-containing protein [Vagococcus fluvialis]